jgi:transcriptional regulator with XRE-family HTH domain
MEHIGESIRLARIEQRLKQFDLGEKCKPKMSQQRISKVERHETNPYKKVVKTIATGLNMTIEELKEYGCIQKNDQQSGGEAANIIIHHTLVEDTLQKALDRAYADIDYWKKRAEDAEAKVKEISNNLSVPVM